jgi:rubrerythrin
MRVNRALVMGLFAVLLAASCKKTVEGENKAWDRNLQKVTELSVLYPGFAPALAEQKKRAEDAMTAARAVSDPEASAKQMAAANDLLSSGFVATLGGLEDKQRSLRTKLVTASTEADHSSDQAGAKAAVDDAQRILRNFDDQIKAGAKDAATAQVMVRKIDDDLSTATSNLNRVIDAAKQRKAAAAKAAAPTGATGTTGTATPPAAKVTWKCTYCGTVNDDSAKKCPHCGAPRPDPNAPKKKGK